MFDESSHEHGISRDDEIKSRKASQARVRRNRRRGLAFEEAMFRRSSRYLVLFLTLNYQKPYGNASATVCCGTRRTAAQAIIRLGKACLRSRSRTSHRSDRPI